MQHDLLHSELRYGPSRAEIFLPNPLILVTLISMSSSLTGKVFRCSVSFIRNVSIFMSTYLLTVYFIVTTPVKQKIPDLIIVYNPSVVYNYFAL